MPPQHDPNDYPNPYHEDAGWAQAGPAQWGGISAVDMDRTARASGSSSAAARPMTAAPRPRTSIPSMKFDAQRQAGEKLGQGRDRLSPRHLRRPRPISGSRTAFHRAAWWPMWCTNTPGRQAAADHGRVRHRRHSTDRFNGVSDVMVAPDGSIFVADGHSDKTNDRILKYDRNGKFLLQLGQARRRPGRIQRAAWLGVGQGRAGSMSPTVPTAASRSSTSRASSWPNGSSSAGPAASSSPRTT